MKKEKGKKIKLIISLISVGIFIYSYFVVYDNYTLKTSEAYEQVEQLKHQMIEREKKLAEEERVMESIAELEGQKQEIIDSYPVYIAKEDNFMFVEKLDKDLDMSISSLSVSENKSFYKTIIPAIEDRPDTEKQEEAAKTDKKKGSATEIPTMNGFMNSISMGFLTTYEGIKELSEYIRNNPESTAMDNISISFDSSTGALAGNLTLKRFFLTGTRKEYKTTTIEGINIGTDNIFGTGRVNEQDNADINRSDEDN